MKILLLGSGGREHAIAWKITQSPRLKQLFVAPGNAGTSLIATNVNIAPDNFPAIADFAVINGINFIVVGPEDPLVKGIADFFSSEAKYSGIPVIGPSAGAAMLEGSKEFAKKFMVRHKIPTARFLPVTQENISEGYSFLEAMQPPYVLKADGLAAGKGVLIPDTIAEARKELEQMLSGKFGDASRIVVIEEYLKGIELSAFIITDGHDYRILPEAKDYKRVGEGDCGPNTGGMGAVSPVPFAGSGFMKKVEERIIKPTIAGLKKDGLKYKGFIFFGLMNCNGDPFLIEYNVRLGDPETEVILPRLKTDLVEILMAVAESRLGSLHLETDERTVTTVMLVSGGYPGTYEKGIPVKNLEKTSGSIVFHAGTKIEGNTVVTSGGRVISVSSYGNGIKNALKACYRNAEIIDFKGKYFRRDIGFDLIK
jgi:phosphoribosylamine---glycine ligase